MNPEILFAAALAQVESASVRAWIQTEHNRPIAIEKAALLIKRNAKEASTQLTIWIVANAIGLW